jgi:hypothetical protein
LHKRTGRRPDAAGGARAAGAILRNASGGCQLKFNDVLRGSPAPGKERPVRRILRGVYMCSIPVVAYCAMNRYPLLNSSDAILAIGAVGVIGASILGGGDEGRITVPRLLACFLVSLLPWATAGIFVANGMLDRSDEVPHETTVVGVHYYLTSWDIITVRSWRPDRTTETFLWGTYKYGGFLHPGTPVTLRVKSGAVGLPWISGWSRHRG